MQKNILLSLIIVSALTVCLSGCKTEKGYREERAEKAATHFQMAKFRELKIGKTMSLQECIATALKNNLQTRISEMEVQVQKEMETAEALGMLPQLNINDNFTTRSEYNASGSEKIEATGKTYGASYSEDRTINYLNIDLLFSFLDFGLTYFNTRQQADRAFLAKQRGERAAQNLAFDVVRAYFKVAASQRAMNLTNSLLDECKNRYDQIYELGKQRKISPARAFYESKRFIEMEKRLTEYIRNYESSCVELRTLMGYYPNSDIIVDESYLNRVPNFYLPSIDAMEQIAILQRPELYEADIQKHINILECRKVILMMFPNVKLYADWSYSNNSFLYNRSWFELGLRAAYNLLKIPQYVAKYRTYASQVESEEMRSYAQAVAVMAQVRIAEGNFRSALERYKLNRDVHTNYDIHLQDALSMQKSGGTNLSQLDVDHIRLETTQTNIDSIIALGEYYVAYYRLLNVMGVKKFDYRTAEELQEELRLASVRIASEIQKDAREYKKDVEKIRKQTEENRKNLEKATAMKTDADKRKAINAEIDARIKAESAPVTKKK